MKSTAHESQRDDLDRQVEALRESITPDLYTPSEFANWDEIDARLSQLEGAIQATARFAQEGNLSANVIANAISYNPDVYEVLRTIVGAKGSIGFQDGRELPERLPEDPEDQLMIAELLCDLGTDRVLSSHGDLYNLVRVALLNQNSGRRRFKVKTRFENRVARILYASLKSVQAYLGGSIKRLPQAAFPEQAGRAVDFVLGIDSTPVAAIATVFQTSSGGRQQRDLALTYPTLQKRLDEVPVGLILIADGRGIKQTPQRVIRNLLEEVAACITLKQAEEGQLEDAILELARTRGARPGLSAPLDTLIDTALRRGGTAYANSLPAEDEVARLALARYASTRNQLALTLTADGSTLKWSRESLVQRASRLSLDNESAPTEAIDILGELLNADVKAQKLPESDDLAGALFALSGDTVLPAKMLVASFRDGVDAGTLRRVARFASTYAPDSKLATLIVPASPDLESLTRVQSTLAATVTILEYDDLSDLAKLKDLPRDSFVAIVLARTDLTKVSPYVVRSVTPERMFFGREVEQATLVSTLATNSVALLGGRRIGKTSLLQRAKSWLSDADFLPFYGDCQAVGNWDDFGRLTRREWDVDAPTQFRPDHLYNVVSQLSGKGNRPIVFLLDEIDHLLLWDEGHSDDGVPEAFFRTCRSISQEGKAQFVFAGERTIARKLWDPQSPHWNFCQPLPLQQLSHEAAERLLLDPLRSLQIVISKPEEFSSTLWRCTSGHPEIVQLIGDSLVAVINDRPPEARGTLYHADLEELIYSFEYAESYLETYWGQATDLEKLISIVITGGTGAPPKINDELNELGIDVADDEIVAGLRMLELYGIVRRAGAGFVLRAIWFEEALEYYGGVRKAKELFSGKLL